MWRNKWNNWIYKKKKKTKAKSLKNDKTHKDRALGEITNHTSLAFLCFLIFPELHLKPLCCPSPFPLLPSLLLPLHSHLSKINSSSRITLPPNPSPNSPYTHTHMHTYTITHRHLDARGGVERGTWEPETQGDGGWKVLRDLNAWIVCSFNSSHYFSPVLYYT